VKFGQIVEALRDGMHRAARAGWNGKDMWIYVEQGKTIPYDSLREPQKSWLGDDMRILPHFNIRNAKGRIVVGWVASQEDILAEDWELLDPVEYRDSLDM